MENSTGRFNPCSGSHSIDQKITRPSAAVKMTDGFVKCRTQGDITYKVCMLYSEVNKELWVELSHTVFNLSSVICSEILTAVQ